MKHDRRNSLARAASAFLLLLTIEQTFAQAGGEPVRSVVVDIALSADGAAAPVADKGYLLVWKHFTFASSGPSISAYDRNGALFSGTKL